ncbi:MAG: Ig-like domain-containing protein [Anaerosomatales bacterium]|nr:Ig-like domain-containing protein [Anaerosomatales bacterium]
MTRISVSSSGDQGNGGSYDPSISADGRYAAFCSDASNLVAGDTNGKLDVFVRDLATGTTTRVSVSSSGEEGNDYSNTPSISADGRYVTFYSFASNLVSDDTNSVHDVFVRDLASGETTRVSVSSSGVQGNSYSYDPSISADGRYVAFYSHARNLVPDDTNGADDIFVRDLATGTTTRVSVSSSGEEGNGDSYDPCISADGRYVAFYSSASNLVAGDTNGKQDIFVRDLATGTTTRVSVSSSGEEGNGDSYDPCISADGRYAAFHSYASNLVAGDTNGTVDIFVRDLATGTTTRANVSSSRQEANGLSYHASISADGRYVAFYSAASNLVPGDTNWFYDVFVRDLANDAPQAAADAYSTAEDEALTVGAAQGVLANDTDPDGDSLAATLTAGPSHGTLELSADGGFTYTPDPDWHGQDSFTYAASDGSLSATATVTITVDPVNDAPQAAADAYSTAEDEALTVGAAQGVLANDTDPDGDSLAATLTAGPSHGTLELSADGGFTYTPDPDWHGQDSFTYAASDGSLSATATVTITVAPVNDAPQAAADAYMVSYNVTTTIDAAEGVLANDSDPDGDSLAATLTAGPSHGTIELAPDGGFAYTPDSGYSGEDSFTYEASDGSLAATATVTITVSPIETTPVQGSTRITTAIEASKLAFPQGAPAVVIATARNWPDALVGSVLAGVAGGPVLLTEPSALPAEVASEVARLGASKAYIVGGTGAVSSAVATDLAGVVGQGNVERVEGKDRYATARAVAAKAVALQGAAFDGCAFLATGANFPDALGAGPLAAAKGRPIYLVDPKAGADAALISAMKAAGVTHAVALGGGSVVSTAAVDAVAAGVPCSTERWAGADRYATAAQVAQKSVEAGLSFDGVGIATGENFPDALSAGASLGRLGSVLLLTKTASLPDPTRAALSDNKRFISTVRFFGGTGAVSQAVRDEVIQATR